MIPELNQLAKFSLESAANVNATLVKPGEAVLVSAVITNTNAAVRHVKIYDKATAPTVGSDIPEITIPVPASSVLSLNLGLGQKFVNGLGIGTTTLVTNADATAVGAGDLKIRLTYK